MHRVLVGIPVYNGADRLANLFASMRSVSNEDERDMMSVVVLDDGSPRPGEAEKLKKLCEENSARFIAHPANRGITAAWNSLCRAEDSDLIVLLNDDVLLGHHWLQNLVYFLDNNECGAASHNLLFCDPSDVPAILCGEQVIPRHPVTRAQEPERLNQAPDESPGVVMCALGSGFGFRRSVFNQLGGFDESMTMIYNESDFGTAAAAHLKLPSYCIPAPRIWHLWSQSFKENPELGRKASRDQAAYIKKWGGDFQGPKGTHPRFMHNIMPPRVVKWIGPDGAKYEKELTIQ